MKQKMPTKRVKHYSIIVTLTVLLSLLLAAMGFIAVIIQFVIGIFVGGIVHA